MSFYNRMRLKNEIYKATRSENARFVWADGNCVTKWKRFHPTALIQELSEWAILIKAEKDHLSKTSGKAQGWDEDTKDTYVTEENNGFHSQGWITHVKEFQHRWENLTQKL